MRKIDASVVCKSEEAFCYFYKKRERQGDIVN